MAGGASEKLAMSGKQSLRMPGLLRPRRFLATGLQLPDCSNWTAATGFMPERWRRFRRGTTGATC